MCAPGSCATTAPRSTRNPSPFVLRPSSLVLRPSSLVPSHFLTMPTKINIPTPLRPFTGKRDVVEVNGATVGELLAQLTSEHEGLKKHLYNDEGKLRSFVNIYLNDEDIRYLSREETPVKPGDTLSIIPSVAGGSGAAVKEAPVLNPEEVQRYSRHLILPEVGMEGQKKLKASRVLCIGAGGLGSPATMYLAAAGVGTIGLVDF